MLEWQSDDIIECIIPQAMIRWDQLHLAQTNINAWEFVIDTPLLSWNMYTNTCIYIILSVVAKQLKFKLSTTGGRWVTTGHRVDQ